MIENLTEPAPVVTLAEAKQALRIDGDTAFDATLERNIAAATQTLEGDTGRLFGHREIRVTLPRWSPVMPLPAGEIDSVTYTAVDGTDQVLVPSSYVFSERFGQWMLRSASGQSWPALGADGTVRIEMTAGEEASETARQAIIVLAGHWFDNPTGDVPFGYTALMTRLRLSWL